MASFFSTPGRKNVTVFIILLSISFSLILVSRSQLVIGSKEIQELVFYPFRTLSRSMGKIFSIGGSKKSDNLKEELENTKKELLALKKELSSLVDFRRENESLRKIIELKPQIEYVSIVADVIGADLDFNYEYLTINKGRIDGVSKEDPVIAFVDNQKVVVGLVSEASVFTSKIKTIESNNFALGIILEKSHTNGVVEGVESKENLIRLLYISKSVDLQVGEKVYTSPESQLFPPYILVGEVRFIDTTNKAVMSHQSFVSPAVNLRQLSQVFILKTNKENKK